MSAYDTSRADALRMLNDAAQAEQAEARRQQAALIEQGRRLERAAAEQRRKAEADRVAAEQALAAKEAADRAAAERAAAIDLVIAEQRMSKRHRDVVRARLGIGS